MDCRLTALWIAISHFDYIIDCPDGTFGANCTEACQCTKGRVGIPECDNINGRCNCLPGYTGIRCEEGIPICLHAMLFTIVGIECPDGTFGTNCSERCSCLAGRVRNLQCDIVYGACNCLPGYSGLSCENSNNLVSTMG